MSNFLQYTVFGIMFGAGYAIAATGLVVTYTTSGVFNFAQGAVGMIAAFCYWELVTDHHVPILVALVIILIVGASISGALVERVLMRRLHGASAERPVMVTLGLLVILTGFATVIWNPSTQHLVGNMINGQFRLVGINIQYQEVLIIGVAVAVAVGLRLLFYSTRTGVALRAVVDDPELLAMSGASPNRMSQYGWILGFMMAALAGVLLAPTQTTGLSIEAMTLLVVNGYAAAIVGRLKNIPVTFVAAIAIGLAENYVINYVLPHLPQSLVPDVTAGTAHGLLVHRPGHAAVGAAAGRGPPDQGAGPPGGRGQASRWWPAWRSSRWPRWWPWSSTTRRSRGRPSSTWAAWS